MAKIVKPLSPVQVKNAKAKDKPYKLADGGGLYLEVTPTGSKLWRMKFRQTNGKENRLSFGTYPTVTLEEARQKRQDAKRMLTAGTDPSQAKKTAKRLSVQAAANTFEAVGREWFEKFLDEWAETHSSKILQRLEKDIFPVIGRRPIDEITAPELLDALKKIEARGAVETAHRVRSHCGQIFRYAIVTGRAQRDVSQDLKGALKSKKTKHLAALTEPTAVAELLRQIDAYKGSFVVMCALKLAPLVFVRPGELRQAKWKDIDLEKAEWGYVVSKTKTEHIVPLAKQAVAILKELHPLTGHGKYVFPSPRTRERAMSDNAILSALRRMGIDKEEMSGHGFRATARTLLDEILGHRVDLIEHQLAHSVRDPLGRAYNRTHHLPARKKMMQDWANYLDKLKAGAAVIKINTEYAA